MDVSVEIYTWFVIIWLLLCVVGLVIILVSFSCFGFTLVLVFVMDVSIEVYAWFDLGDIWLLHPVVGLVYLC